MKVFVILWDAYGDQGYNFVGVYSTKEKAESQRFKLAQKYKDDLQSFRIMEEVVDSTDIPDLSSINCPPSISP